MLLETVFSKFKDKSPEQVDDNAMFGEYGLAVYGSIKTPAQAATKHPGSKKPHRSHKRKGRKTHQWHGRS